MSENRSTEGLHQLVLQGRKPKNPEVPCFGKCLPLFSGRGGGRGVVEKMTIEQSQFIRDLPNKTKTKIQTKKAEFDTL